MTDLRERFRALDALAVPDVMAQARLIGPKPPQLEPPATSRRVGAILLVAAIAIAAMVVGTRLLRGPASTPATTGPDIPVDPEQVGFIGLPPEGAAPSTPEDGELVLSFSGRSLTDGGSLIEAWVYADGRLIWEQAGDFPFEANETRTGLLEQRLTPEGVELLRSEFVSTGMFDHDHELLTGRVRETAAGRQQAVGVIWGSIQVREGDRLITVDWSNPEMYPLAQGTVATPGQASGLERLDGLLTHPASWLPTSAWLSGVNRAYVPSRYAVCYEPVERGIDPSRILGALPTTAGDLLRATAISGPRGATGCSSVTTEEAHELARTFDDAGLERDDRSSYGRLGYVFEPSVALAPGPIENTVSISFEPILPHGRWTCSVCG
jgi:hypothetical protein